MLHYSLNKGMVEHLNKPDIFAISEYETSSTINPLSLNSVFNLTNPFSDTITFSDIEFNVFGGHLFDAKIAAAGEFVIDSCNFEIKRKYNANLGLHLWCMEDK